MTTYFLPLLLAIVLLSVVGCNESGDRNRLTNAPGKVTFIGGYETNPLDHGRPVVLIGAALGVTEEIFRDAFRGVTPSRNGPPSRSKARANKRVLMDALGKHGVTNERLDEVSDYYRYRREAGEMWRHTPAAAVAVVEDGQVVDFEITDAGSGYTTAPIVKVAGFEDLDVEVTIEFSTDLSRNGRVASLSVSR